MKNKELLDEIYNSLSDENYHRLARAFYNYSNREDVEEITFNEFLVWFKDNWTSVLT